MHYQSKQDLAMAYFPDRSKESASKRFAHEIHSNKPLLDALQATGYSRPQATYLLTLTTSDGRQHTVRLLKQSDIFGN